jgi:sulfite exporter TauE/SafE
MSSDLTALLALAVSIGFIHTLFGPDHYLPFIMMATSNKWSHVKTTWITLLCGIGHVGSSIILGLTGVAAGIAVDKLEVFESIRGELAGWALIAFGLVYTVWGLRRAYKNKPHTHIHFHSNGQEHSHEHRHHDHHAHFHDRQVKSANTAWALFVIFVLGPCEPLIPTLMYPAAKGNKLGVILVAAVFGVVTIATMLSVVILGVKGINFLPVRRLERYVHALAGFTILLCGCAIQFLGL